MRISRNHRCIILISIFLALFGDGCSSREPDTTGYLPKTANIVPRTVVGGATSTGTVDLKSSAPVGGVATVPSTVTVGDAESAGNQKGIVVSLGQESSLLANRQIIRTADITLRVKNTSGAEESVNRIVAKVGGYVDSQEGQNLSDENPSMTMHIRVPVKSYELVVNDLEKLGVRRAKSVHSEDVTQQMVDLEARSKTLETEEVTLRDMLRQTRKVADMLEVHNRITEVRSQIESMKAQLKTLGSQAAFSTINVTLEQTALPGNPSGSDPGWFGQAWAQATGAAVSAGRGLVIFSLWVLVFSPALVLIYVLGNRFWNKVIQRLKRPPVHNAPDSSLLS